VSSRFNIYCVILVLIYEICVAAVARAQVGVRGQIFLPNGAPAQRQIRFTLTTDNGTRTDLFYTDSNGRIAISRMTIPYSITVESDGESYDKTVASFDPASAGNYIMINLRSLKPAMGSSPGIVRALGSGRDVSPKARKAYDEAITLLQAAKYNQALQLLRLAVSLQPDFVQARNDLGALYLKLNQVEEAEKTLREAIRLDDKWYLPRLNLGLVLNRQRKYKEAAELLTALQNTHPDQIEIQAPLIEALIEAHEWPRAEEELRRALLRKEADTVDLKIKLGMVNMRQGKFLGAVAAFREAISSEPDNALAQFNLGAALLESGQLDEAESALVRAHQLNGDKMPGIQLQLGQLYFRKKEYNKAIEAFEAFLRDVPNAPNAAQVKEALTRLRQAANKP
jgi:Flp pilus assembly protein TadD